LDDVRSFIRKTVHDLVKSMAANMTIQEAAAFELMCRVNPRLLDETTGRTEEKPCPGVYQDI